MTEPTGSFYVTGGTLKPGEPSYVERRADTELFESLLAGELCYVLTARQMGKSSLMARTAKRLEQAGVASAIVDLTQIGSERGSQAAAQWYFGVANKIHQQLKIAEPLRPWWQERADLSSVQRLTDFFREVVLPHHPGKIVVFVDEIDSTIGLPFADDFFAAIRACFNARATEPDFERLTFVLLGVATPDQLIRDQTRTPFNIGKRIDLTDFSSEEAQGLASGLHADPGEAGRRLERVLHWTGGHPYLTQALCRAVREKSTDGTSEQTVDPRVQELFLASQAQREETNLKHARARLERPGAEGRRLLQLYRRVRQGKPVPDQATSPLFAQLKLAGVVKATGEGLLAVRNRVYEEVFTPAWAKSAMPVDRGRQLAGATLAAFLTVLGVWYSVFQPRPYEQALQAAIKDDGYNTAIEAYRALRANPFSRSRATDLMQDFWEKRGLRYALDGKRDESLLSYLQGLDLKESETLRKKIQNLVGVDYEHLRTTLITEESVSGLLFPSKDDLWTTHRGASRIELDERQSPYAEILQFPSWHWETRSGKLIEREFGICRLSRGGFLLGARIKAQIIDRIYSADDLMRARFSNGILVMWDPQFEKALALQTPEVLLSTISALALSPDGRTLATGSRFRVQLWDVDSRQLDFALIHNGSNSLAFNPNGKHLATGSFDGTTQIWDAQTGQLLTSLVSHQEPISSLAFSHDNHRLATGSWDDTVQIWDPHTGQAVGPPLQHEGSVTSLAFSLDGKSLAVGSSRTAKIWDIQALSTRPSEARERRIYNLRFSPDGQTIIKSFGNSLQISESQSGNQTGVTLDHPTHVFAFEISPDGKTLASGSDDGFVRFWDVYTGSLLRSPLPASEETIAALAFSPDGKRLAISSYDFRVRVWDFAAGQFRSFTRLSDETVPVSSLAFSPDGRYLAGGSEGFTELWDVRTGKAVGGQLQQGDRSPVVVAFSADSQTLATASLHVQIWSTKTGKPLSSPGRLHEEAKAAAFTNDGKGFFVATARWLNNYEWEGQQAELQSSQLLHGFWRDFHLSANCESCLRVALGDTGNPLFFEALNLNLPNDPPIQGDPKELLRKWQLRLGLTFDNEMRPVPR